MTAQEICNSAPFEIDALVHRYYDDGSANVPLYSTDWKTVEELAKGQRLGLMTFISASGTAVLSLFRNGKDLGVGASAELTEDDQKPEKLPTALAALASRAMLKFC